MSEVPSTLEVIDRLARIESKLDFLSDLPARVAILEAYANRNKGRDTVVIGLTAIGAGIVGGVLTAIFVGML